MGEKYEELYKQLCTEVSISQNDQNYQRVKMILYQLEPEVNQIEENDPQKYGFFKYQIANLCVQNSQRISLTEKEKNKYKNHMNIFKQDYQKYTQDQNDSNLLNDVTQNENPSIKYKLEECLRQHITNTFIQQSKYKKKYFLTLGNTGEGKSSFLKLIKKDSDDQTINSTLTCEMFKINDKQFIDSPGINNIKKSRYENLLTIAQFLKNKQIQLEDIFIILIQSHQLNSLKPIQEFSYVYFLYEIFKGNIDHKQVEKLMKEYFLSCYLLNWEEQRFDLVQDEFSRFRKEIFKNKDKAGDYFQHFYSYQITVKTFFDKSLSEDFQQIDEQLIEYQQEQIWSNKYQENIFGEYNNYIKYQESHLFQKIEQIIDNCLSNNLGNENNKFENILLIGKSQVGKSSLIEQLTKQKRIRVSRNHSNNQICQFYRVDYNDCQYRFIDTPGYEGSQENQNPFHSLKISADFLLRNKIKKFKIIQMRDPIKGNRETNVIALNYFFSYISVERQNKNKLEYISSTLNNKILQILRVSYDDEKQIEDLQQKCQLLSPSTIKFESNYFTKNRKLIQVRDEKDKMQIKELFQKVKLLQDFNIEQLEYKKKEINQESNSHNKQPSQQNIYTNNILIIISCLGGIGVVCFLLR